MKVIHNINTLNEAFINKASFKLISNSVIEIKFLKQYPLEDTENPCIYKKIALDSNGLIKVLIQGDSLSHVIASNNNFIHKETKTSIWDTGNRMTSGWSDKKHGMSKKEPDFYSRYNSFEETGAYFSWLINYFDKFFDPNKELLVSDEYIKISSKITGKKVAVFGLGGTGSHILEALVKNDIKDISIYDNDVVQLKNLSRFPGVHDIKEAIGKKKVEYFTMKYNASSTNIKPQHINLSRDDIVVENIDFAFIALDKRSPKLNIISKLKELKIPYIMVGLWMDFANDLKNEFNMSLSIFYNIDINKIPNDSLDAYEHNVQIYEANALNANLAIIAFKKIFGYYQGKLSPGIYRFNQPYFTFQKVIGDNDE